MLLLLMHGHGIIPLIKIYHTSTYSLQTVEEGKPTEKKITEHI